MLLNRHRPRSRPIVEPVHLVVHIVAAWSTRDELEDLGEEQWVRVRGSDLNIPKRTV